MLEYLIRRLLLVIPTLFGITVVVFAIITLSPGDPAALRVSDVQDPEMSERIYEELRKRFHLDQPIHYRYGLWIKDLATGNLGTSMWDDYPVAQKIRDAFWPTVSVNLAALVLALVISLPIGIYSAAKRNGWFDRVSGVVLYSLYSIPSYVGAIILVLYLGVRWDLLPFRGMKSDEFSELGFLSQQLDVISHMTLYVLCAAYGSLAYYSRFVRQNLLEVIQQDFIRTARAKGVPEPTVILRHGFRNSLIPFLTLVGLVVPTLLGGSVILEVIFTWPGLGRLFFVSILQRDYPVIMALSTATAILVLFATLFVDLLYGVVDPRVSHG